MGRLIAKMNRGLSSARSIPLYKDQEDSLVEIKQELAKLGRKLPPTTEVVRMGVDLLIDQLRKELELDEKEI